ncbi:hypothetical protein [Burkholderia savannae]|uniref:hypothetical protein n=1 Tax=Burkholderia savannae TaxID=1637837 RepID=UPI0012E3C6B7|nr:hypothetical protein [Burkholderia savannae]
MVVADVEYGARRSDMFGMSKHGLRRACDARIRRSPRRSAWRMSDCASVGTVSSRALAIIVGDRIRTRSRRRLVMARRLIGGDLCDGE